MKAITIEKKTPLGKKIMFAAASRAHDETRAVLMGINICTADGKNYVVGTDGCSCLFAELSEDDLKEIPAGVYKFDETKTRLILEADTDGVIYPDWGRAVPKCTGAPISDLITLGKGGSGKVNALVGANNMIQPERTFYIRNELFVLVEKVAKGKTWSMWQPAYNGPIRLDSDELHAVIMPMNSPTNECDRKKKSR